MWSIILLFMFPFPFLHDEFETKFSIIRSQIVDISNKSMLTFNYFYFSAVFHWELNKMADFVQCPSLVRNNKKNNFERSITICWHTCRCRNPIEANHTESSCFIFVYIFFFCFVILYVYFVLFFIVFFFSLFLFSSHWMNKVLCPHTQAVAVAACKMLWISFEEHNPFDMRRFILSAVCTNDKFRIFFIVTFGRYVRHESRFFLITMRNTYPIRSVSTRTTEKYTHS